MACLIGAETLVLHLLNEEGVEINEFYEDYGSALIAAVTAREEAIVVLLLSNNADVNIESDEHGTALDIAVSVSSHQGISKMLLDYGASPLLQSQNAWILGSKSTEQFDLERYDMEDSSSPTLTILRCAAILGQKDLVQTYIKGMIGVITPENILLASSTQSFIDLGPECLAILLDLLDNTSLQSEEILTGEVVETLTCIQATAWRALDIVINQNRQKMLFTEKILRNLSVVKGANLVLQEYLTKNNGPHTEITPALLHIVAKYYDDDTMRCFMASSSTMNLDIADLLLSAVENERYCDTILQVLPEFALMPDLNDGQLQQALFHKSSTIQPLKIFRQVSSFAEGLQLMLIEKLLSELRWGEAWDEEVADLFEHVLKHSDKTSLAGLDVKWAIRRASGIAIELLLKYMPQKFVIDETALVAATGNSFHAKGMMEILLPMAEPLASSGERVFIAAAKAGIEVLELLLEENGHEMKITTNIMLSAAGKRSTLTLLLDHNRDGAYAVASTALQLAAKRESYQRGDPVINLLSYCPDFCFELTERVMLDILEKDPDTAYEELTCVVNKFGERAEITERIFAAAASSSRETLTMLRNSKPDAFKITPSFVAQVAASGNTVVLNSLVKESGEEAMAGEEVQRLATFRSIIRYSDEEEMLEKLKDEWQKGRIVDLPDAHGMTALHAASNQYRTGEGVITFLLHTMGADIHAVERRGWTPLHIAVHRGEGRTIAALIRAGANPNFADLQGETPLSLEEKAYETVKLDGFSEPSPTYLTLLKGSAVTVQDHESKHHW